MYGWDWSATTHEAHHGVVDDLLHTLGAVFCVPGKGLQGWSQSVEAFDEQGFALGRIYFGGGREDVHVVSSSTPADQVRDLVCLDAKRVRTARVDTRVDSLVPFEELAGILEYAASGYGSMITRMESSVRGESTGRTVYLGAPSSAVRVRLYEKWLESPGEYVEGTNRVEVQLRPPSKAKERVSGWNRAQTFCASKVTQELADRLGADLVPAASLHVRRGTPDLERTIEAMAEQYGKAARRYCEVFGSVDDLLERLLLVEA